MSPSLGTTSGDCTTTTTPPLRRPILSLPGGHSGCLVLTTTERTVRPASSSGVLCQAGRTTPGRGEVAGGTTGWNIWTGSSWMRTITPSRSSLFSIIASKKPLEPKYILFSILLRYFGGYMQQLPYFFGGHEKP